MSRTNRISGILRDRDITDTSFTPSVSLANGEYAWEVQALNANGEASPLTAAGKHHPCTALLVGQKRIQVNPLAEGFEQRGRALRQRVNFVIASGIATPLMSE